MEGRPGRCGAGGPDGSLAVQATGSAACAARLALPAAAASSGNGAFDSDVCLRRVLGFFFFLPLNIFAYKRFLFLASKYFRKL